MISAPRQFRALGAHTSSVETTGIPKEVMSELPLENSAGRAKELRTAEFRAEPAPPGHSLGTEPEEADQMF